MKKTRVILAVILVALSFMAGVGFGPAVTGAVKDGKADLETAGRVSITYQAIPSDADMADTIYKLQQRVSQYNIEAQIYKEGSNRINVEIPGVTNVNAILASLGNTGSLEFKTEDGTVVITDRDVETASALTGTDDKGNKIYSVELRLTEEGANKFGEATTNNIGKPLYIIYNGETISYPTIESAVTSGLVYINHLGSQEAAESFASNICIGSLPVMLEVLNTGVITSQPGDE